MEYVIKSNNPNESAVARMIEQVRRQPVQIMKKDDCKVVPVIDRTKWKPCHYCECGIYSDFAYDYSMGEDTGNYCKYCGRPMTEQAWKELERKIFGE